MKDRSLCKGLKSKTPLYRQASKPGNSRLATLAVGKENRHMMSRRKFITTAVLGSAGAAVAGYALNARNARAQYDALVQRTWRHTQGDVGTHPAQMLELVRYATLAPSSHNTQCWKFRIGEDTVSILPDFQRRCPVVDPDDHHLFVSLGCAAENLIQAAAANGFRGDLTFNVGGDESVHIALVAAKPIVSPLFEAIPFRQSTRGEFDGKPISSEDLKLLEEAGSGNGVRVHLLTERKAMEQVLEFVIQGNTAQMRDRAFVGNSRTGCASMVLMRPEPVMVVLGFLGKPIGSSMAWQTDVRSVLYGGCRKRQICKAYP
jgi:hypothetical protein